MSKIFKLFTIVVLGLTLGFLSPSVSYAQGFGFDRSGIFQKMSDGMRNVRDRINRAQEAISQMRDLQRRSGDLIKEQKAKIRENNRKLKDQMRDNKVKMKEARALAKAKQRDTRDKMRRNKEFMRSMKNRTK